MGVYKFFEMKTFKKINKSLIAMAIALSISTACDDGFAEMNTNPSTSDQLGTEYLLNFVINRGGSERYETWRGNLIYCSQWTQHLAGDWDPDQYITTNEDWLSAYWVRAYGDYMRNLSDIIRREPTTNIGSMATIMKVLLMQRVTDMHGDIPYSEAFQGGAFPQPSYDTQEEIYTSFIEELTTAIGQLSEGNGQNPFEFDQIYGGDIDKWKKFGNSVLLRVGMRLSEVNSALAESTVAAALAGGVMTSNDDMAYITFDGSYTSGVNSSGIGSVFQDFGVSGHLFRFSDEFVSRIVDNNDPRESTLMETYLSDGSVDTSVGAGNHIGRPNGEDVTDSYQYAQPHREIMVAYNSPVIYLSFAEVEFNRAEAIQRGWASGSVQDAYESGITAAIKHLSIYPGATEVDDASITTYLAEPNIAFNSANAMEQINTQKWIALFLDGFEAYSNQRRTGYPALTPGDNVGESDGVNIPGRMRYPVSEELTNGDNYAEAVSRMSGGDVISENVWWDVN